MKPHLRYILLAMLLATALLGISRPAATQQQEEESKQVLDFTNLTLEIASTKQKFIPLEPIPIILTLSNETSQKVLGHDALEFGSNHVELYVTRDGGERRKILQQLSPYLTKTIVNSKKIAPGKRTQAKELLTIDLDKIFPEPGTYRLEAVLHDADWKLQITSAPLTLQISVPEGNDVAAYGFLKQLKLSRFFNGSGLYAYEEEREALEEFVTAYGESTYGDYATFLSGSLHRAKKDYQKAFFRLSKLAAKSNFYLADKAKEYLDEIKQKTKDSTGIQ